MEKDETKMHWKKLIALFCCFFVYLFLGAITFHHLESDNEQKTRARLREAKKDIKKDYGCLEDDALEDLVNEVTLAIESGIDPAGNSTSPSIWDYASAFFFCGTVVTTIGYGRTVPTTDLGRNVCLLYALFGIPFTGWLLATTGNFYCDFFHSIARMIEDFFHTKLGFKHSRLKKFLLYIFVFCISYGLIVLVPSSWFYIMEQWSFDEAHYYSFITLSTIGFGDFVASVDSHHPKNRNLAWLYDIAVACWYVFGLSYLACIITAIGKEQKHTITKLRNTVSFHTGRRDPEPLSGFGLSEIDINAETDLNEEVLKQNGCTCAHNPNFRNSLSVIDVSTQTD